MSKSLIQTANASSQNLTEGSVISLGRVIRRYGCNCNLNGNAIEVDGTGYYKVTATVTLAPTEVGNVTVSLYENGVAVPSAFATGSVTTANNPITIPIVTTIREGCCCDGASQLTFVLSSGNAAITNISASVEKS